MSVVAREGVPDSRGGKSAALTSESVHDSARNRVTVTTTSHRTYASGCRCLETAGLMPGRSTRESSSAAAKSIPAANQATIRSSDCRALTPSMNSSKIRTSSAEAESASGWNCVPTASQSSI